MLETFPVSELVQQDIDTIQAAIIESFPDQSASEIARDIKDIASENGVSYIEAFQIKAALEFPEVDKQIAYGYAKENSETEFIDKPYALQGAFVPDGKFEQVVKIIAEKNPDSDCAKIGDLINERADILQEIESVKNEQELLSYREDNESEIELDKLDRRLDDLESNLENLEYEIQDFVDELDKGKVELTSKEEALANDLISEDRNGNFEKAEEITNTIKDVIKVSPNSVLAELVATREDYLEALSGITPNSTSEDKVELVEKYKAYNDCCYDIYNGIIVNEDSLQISKEDSQEINDDAKDNSKDDMLDSEKLIDKMDSSGEAYLENEDDADTESDSNSDIFVENDVQDNQDNTVAIDTETLNTKEWDNLTDAVPNIKDAQAVLDYGVAEKIHEHWVEYPAFGDNENGLRSTVSNAKNGVDAIAKDETTLSAKLTDIVNELETLGEKNGDTAHDSRIDECMAQKEEIILYAGAIVRSEMPENEKDKLEDIRDFIKFDREIRIDGNANEDNVECRDNRLESIRETVSKNQFGSDSISVKFESLLQKRDIYEKNFEKAEEKYNKATADEKESALEGYKFARLSLDDTQRSLDKIGYAIEICDKGEDKFGTIELQRNDIDTDSSNDEQEDIDNDNSDIDDDSIEEQNDTNDDISNRENDLKDKIEKYNIARTKYSSRNFFVCLDKLEMDLESRRLSADGIGKGVSGGVIAYDVISLLGSNILESVLYAAIISLCDKVWPDDVDKGNDTVDQGNKENNNVVDKGDGKHIEVINDTRYVYADYQERYFDNGTVSDKLSKSEIGDLQQDNPLIGRYFGVNLADTPNPKDNKVLGIEVYRVGKHNGVTIDKLDTGITYKDGSEKVIKIPSMRVGFEKNGGVSVIDALGNTIWTNKTTQGVGPDMEVRPHYDKLDISKQKGFDEAAEKLGLTTDQLKDAIVEKQMGKFANEIDRHLNKLEVQVDNSLVKCQEEKQMVKDRIDFLDQFKDNLEKRIDNPKSSDTDSGIEGAKKQADIVSGVKDRLEIQLKGLEQREEQLIETKKNCNEYAVTCKEFAQDKDIISLKACDVLSKARGYIENPYIEGTGTATDQKQIDTILETTGFDKDDKKLYDLSVDKGCPAEPNVEIDKYGAKHDTAPTTREQNSIEVREMLGDAINQIPQDDMERKFPGLVDRREVNITDDSVINDVIKETNNGTGSIDKIEDNTDKIGKEDIGKEIDKHCAIATDLESTFSFKDDFLMDNKDNIDPNTLVEAFKEKLEAFFEESSIDKDKIELTADCLASVRDIIVDSFTDKVIDKIEVVISDAIEKSPDNGNAEIFVDKLLDSTAPIVEKAETIGIDTTVPDGVWNKLEGLKDLGVSDEQIASLGRVVGAVNGAIETYVDTIKSLATGDSSEFIEKVKSSKTPVFDLYAALNGGVDPSANVDASIDNEDEAHDLATQLNESEDIKESDDNEVDREGLDVAKSISDDITDIINSVDNADDANGDFVEDVNSEFEDEFSDYDIDYEELAEYLVL